MSSHHLTYSRDTRGRFSPGDQPKRDELRSERELRAFRRVAVEMGASTPEITPEEEKPPATPVNYAAFSGPRQPLPETDWLRSAMLRNY